MVAWHSLWRRKQLFLTTGFTFHSDSVLVVLCDNSCMYSEAKVVTLVFSQAKASRTEGLFRL